MTKHVETTLLNHRLRGWLESAAEKQASDIHLVAGYPAVLRVFGKMIPIEKDSLSESSILESLKPIVSDEMVQRLSSDKNSDFAFSTVIGNDAYRLRVNLFLACGSVGACFRLIPDSIPDFRWSSFPEELAKKIASFRNGLVLFTGVTGSGKSTSLAMIINRMNRSGGYRIITVEDPVEYRFPICESSVVTQRELGDDVDSFADGLKFGLRQDPDVILVGEIRDSETAKMALSAAETGHLVLSTLHTRDSKGAISRYADMFPQQVQNEIRCQLASCIRAVICQRLLDSSLPNEKQELALEIMFNNAAIASAIRTGKLESIDNYILTGRSDGMLTMDESIKRLVASGAIRMETAESHVTDKAFLTR